TWCVPSAGYLRIAELHAAVLRRGRVERDGRTVCSLGVRFQQQDSWSEGGAPAAPARFHMPLPLRPRAPAALPETDADSDDVPIPCGFLEVSRRISKRLASKVDRHASVSQ